jgi:hypothetical protein
MQCDFPYNKQAKKKIAKGVQIRFLTLKLEPFPKFKKTQQ